MTFLEKEIRSGHRDKYVFVLMHLFCATHFMGVRWHCMYVDGVGNAIVMVIIHYMMVIIHYIRTAD